MEGEPLAILVFYKIMKELTPQSKCMNIRNVGEPFLDILKSTTKQTADKDAVTQRGNMAFRIRGRDWNAGIGCRAGLGAGVD
ncbi:hypothetical protein QTO34_015479 [Cnephaeus nilssonii]|uniref:Uncharacterized protein n=1 Tax=Cnephaeus nilssonii TaxID=3371016 RepID=A0AA40I464_CNENI|nr:hypothetical protein QTO34_015479 [Eptesicus nilssonii]